MARSYNPLAPAQAVDPDQNPLQWRPSAADAYSYNAPVVADAAKAAQDPQTWLDAAHQWGQAMIAGIAGPEGMSLGAGGQMARLKMSRWGPQNEYFSVPIEYRKVPIADPYPAPKFGIDPDGQAYYSGTHYPDQTQITRAIDAHLAPFGEDTYVRSVLRKDDFQYLANGTHRGSTNHATGEPEGGLSVAHSAELPSNYAYLVKGDRIGSGSDFEPLLDTASAKPASRLMKWDKFSAIQREAIDARVKALGLSSDEYRALASGHKQIILPQK